MPNRKAVSQPAGTTKVKIQIPETLHATMKRLREIRHHLEGADVKLCRLYREAVEQFVNARAQQKLLKEFKDAPSTTAAAKAAASKHHTVTAAAFNARV